MYDICMWIGNGIKDHGWCYNNGVRVGPVYSVGLGPLCMYIDRRLICPMIELRFCLDALYIWWNMWYIRELTKLYAYRCG